VEKKKEKKKEFVCISNHELLINPSRGIQIYPPPDPFSIPHPLLTHPNTPISKNQPTQSIQDEPSSTTSR